MDRETAIEALCFSTGMGAREAARALGKRVLHHNENWSEALAALAPSGPTLVEQLEAARTLIRAAHDFLETLAYRDELDPGTRAAIQGMIIGMEEHNHGA